MGKGSTLENKLPSENGADVILFLYEYRSRILTCNRSGDTSMTLPQLLLYMGERLKPTRKRKALLKAIGQTRNLLIHVRVILTGDNDALKAPPA